MTKKLLFLFCAFLSLNTSAKVHYSNCHELTTPDLVENISKNIFSKRKDSSTEISLNRENIEITTYGQTVKLVATIMPEDASDIPIIWSSSDESVAVVNNEGVVSVLANGTAVITATINDSSRESASCCVSVNIPSNDIVWGIPAWNIDNAAVFSDIDDFNQTGVILTYPNPSNYTITFFNLLTLSYDVYVDGNTTPISCVSSCQTGTAIKLNYSFVEGHSYKIVTTGVLFALANLTTNSTDTLSLNSIDSYEISFSINGPELVKTINVEQNMSLEITDQTKPLTFSLIDQKDVLDALGVTSTSSVEIYGLRTNGAYVPYSYYGPDYFNGWRDADGEYTTREGGWNILDGHNAYPAVYCIQLNQTCDSVTYYFYDYWSVYNPSQEIKNKYKAPETHYNSIIWDVQNADGTITKYKRNYRCDEGSNYSASFVVKANNRIVRINAVMHFLSIEDSHNQVSMSDLHVIRGKTVQLPINIKNEGNVVGVSYTVNLPDGVSVALDEDNEPIYTLNSSRINSKHFSVTAAQQSDGSWGFRLYTTSVNGMISGSEGEIMTITLNVDQAMAEGDYQVFLRDNKLSVRDDNNNVSTVKLADVTSVLTVIALAMGDVNADDEVDLSDAILVIYNTLNIASSNFHDEVADMNGDSEIDLSDAIAIIYKSLGLNSDNAKNRSESNTFNDNFDRVNANTECSSCVLLLANSNPYLGLQFDVELPNGMCIEDIQVNNERTKDFSVFYNHLNNGKYRVISFSTDGKPFEGDNGVLMYLQLGGTGSGLIHLSNIFAVNSRLGKKYFDNIIINATNIHSLNTDGDALKSAYYISGRKTDRLNNGLMIINGKKVYVK